MEAFATGVTFRDLIIGVLREYCYGPGGIESVKRAAGMRGVRAGISHGGEGKRVAEGGSAHDRASAGAGAVDGSLRKDQGDDAQKTEGDEW